MAICHHQATYTKHSFLMIEALVTCCQIHATLHNSYTLSSMSVCNCPHDGICPCPNYSLDLQNVAYSSTSDQIISMKSVSYRWVITQG